MKKYANEECELIMFNMDLDTERPIIIDSILTNYSITIDGDVISYKNYAKRGPLKLTPINVNGYLKVNLLINGKEKMYSIHRLYANAFIPNPENKPEVNHINGLKHIDKEYNLEWATSKENIQHAVKYGLKNGMKGSLHPCAKIDEKCASKICELIVDGYSNKEISKILNVSYNIVKKIRNKSRWTHVSKNYSF